MTIFNMLLIQLYPFIYTDAESNNVLLYNTLNSEFKLLNFPSKISTINRTTFIVKKNPINNKLADIIVNNSLGIVQKTNMQNHQILLDYSSVLTQYYNSFIMPEWGSKFVEERYISRLIINMTNFFDLFTNTMNKGIERETIMNSKTFHQLWTNLSRFKNLKKICLNTSWDALKKHVSTISMFINNYKDIDINIPIHDFLQHKQEILEIYKGKINLMVYNIDNSLKKLIFGTSHLKYIPIHIFITSIEDYLLLESWNVLEKENISIEINSNGEKQFLEDLLRYEITDIFNSPLSLNQILRKEKVNILYWGDSFIDLYGNWLIAPNTSIGNINNWDNIKFNMLLSEDSLWRKTRINFEPCHNCCFRNICPPISIIELQSKKHFCRIRYDTYSFIKS